MIYDICVIGAGCAGWQLLYQLSLKPEWTSQKVLLIDKSENPPVYPTWCFWVKEPHPLEFLSSKTWNSISIGTPEGILEKPLEPYRYIYIEGKAFHDYFLEVFLPANPNITFLKPYAINSIEKVDLDLYAIHTENQDFKARKVYTSHDFRKVNRKGYLNLSQNFKGWQIEFEEAILDENKALFMDFRNSGESIFEFMYILPFTKKIGLIEWTTFIDPGHTEPYYEEKIKQYLLDFFPNKAFKILRKEHGEIPMTNFPFKEREESGLIHIGTVAGMIKPSTGYTFNRITKDSKILAEGFKGVLSKRPKSNFKFRYYDTLLLRTLRDEPKKARKIFIALFNNTPYPTIFKFLDEETTFLEDVLIFARLPFFPLIRAIFKR